MRHGLDHGSPSPMDYYRAVTVPSHRDGRIASTVTKELWNDASGLSGGPPTRSH